MDIKCCYGRLILLLVLLLTGCHGHGDEPAQPMNQSATLHFTYAQVTQSVVMVTEPDNRTVEYHVWTAGKTRDCRVNISSTELEKVVKRYEKKKMGRKDIFFIDVVGRWGNASLHLEDFTAVDPTHESKFKFLPFQLAHFGDLVHFETLSSSHIDKSFFPIPLNFTPDCMYLRHNNHKLPKISKTRTGDSIELEAWDMNGWAVDVFYAALLYIVNSAQDFHPEDERELCSVHKFVERPESPFVFLRCCQYGEKNLLHRDKDDIELDCHKPDRGTKFVRNAIIIPALVLLLFSPLAIRCVPTKPRICKKLLKDQKHAQRNRKQGKHRKYNDAESEFIDRTSRRKLLSSPAADGAGDVADTTTVVELSQISPISETQDFLTAPDHIKDRMIHNRVFLDSDSEFHLSPTLVLSYMFLFNKKNHLIVLFRRLVFLFFCWMLIGMIIFISAIFYTAMLRSNAMKFQITQLDKILNFFLHEKHHRFNPYRTADIYPRLYLSLFGFPVILSLIQIITLWFVFLKPRSIATSLVWKDDYKFFGIPIPNIRPVEMQSKHKKSKPSAILSDEILLSNTMIRRINNIGGATFWRFWWSSVLCVPLSCCKNKKSDSGGVSVLKRIISVFWYILRFPFCILMVLIYVLPVFSVWHNLIFEQDKLFSLSDTFRVLTGNKVFRLLVVVVAVFGILLTYLMVMDLFVLCGQVVVFMVIDMMRHATETLPRIILFISVFVYIRSAFTHFEDDYRGMKELILDTCSEVNNDVIADAENDVRVVVAEPPHEPLFIEHKDAEVSIPRCVFYSVCKLHMPYSGKLTSTVIHLAGTLAVIIILFLAIVEYQILDQFSEVGDTFITIFTVSIPSLFGMFKSATHQSLSERRRNKHISLQIRDMVTTVRQATPDEAEFIQNTNLDNTGEPQNENNNLEPSGEEPRKDNNSLGFEPKDLNPSGETGPENLDNNNQKEEPLSLKPNEIV